MSLARFDTVFSVDRKYRYTLWREWQCQPVFGSCQLASGHKGCHSQESKGFVQFIGLNPSTADEKVDDPTIRRCKAFAKHWGFSAMCMTNLFAIRSKNPKGIMVQDPIGEDNFYWLAKVAASASLIVCAWGNNGSYAGCFEQVIGLLQDRGHKLHCFRKTNRGHPEHPLYMPHDKELETFP